MPSTAGPPRTRLRALSWRDILTVGVPAVLVIGVVFAFAGRLVQTAPPGHIRMISGSPGSSFRNQAEKYKKIIEAHGVKVEIVPSEGALDNLRRLADPHSSIDVGFVQGGLTEGVDITHLVSLGTVFTQPLMIYYRLPQPIDRLTELKGKRIAIGAEGSGTHALALRMLKANEMDARNTKLISEHGEEAARALVADKVDAAFLMGDSVTTEVMRGMREAAGVRLMSFRQADGYVPRELSRHRVWSNPRSGWVEFWLEGWGRIRQDAWAAEQFRQPRWRGDRQRRAHRRHKRSGQADGHESKARKPCQGSVQRCEYEKSNRHWEHGRRDPSGDGNRRSSRWKVSHSEGHRVRKSLGKLAHEERWCLGR